MQNIEEIDKIFVACPYCGRINKFTDLTCIRCNGDLDINLRVIIKDSENKKIVDDPIKEIERSWSFGLPRETALEEFKRHEREKEEKAEQLVMKRVLQTETMKTIVKSLKPRNFGNNLVGIILAIVIGIGFLLIFSAELVFVPFDYSSILFNDSELLTSLIFAFLPLIIMLFVVQKIKRL